MWLKTNEKVSQEPTWGFFPVASRKKKKRGPTLSHSYIYLGGGASYSYITYLVQVQLWLRSGTGSLSNWLVLFWGEYFTRGFPGCSAGKESAYNVGNPGWIPGSGRSPGEGLGSPLQHSWASLTAHTVKNRLQYGGSGFNPLGGKIPWRRACQPMPVFLPGEHHGQMCLAGFSPRGYKESDTTERLNTE